MPGLKCESCLHLTTETTPSPAQFLIYKCLKLKTTLGVRSDVAKKIGEICKHHQAKNI